MMIFTFLFLILALAGCCLVTRKRSVIPVISCGATAAVLVCAFRTFFLYAHRVIPYSFGENFAFLLIRQAVLPVLILYGLFFLLSRDSLEFKADMFLPLCCSFYMIYLPYCIVSGAEGLYSAFSLFVKPVIFAAMLFQLSFCIKKLLAVLSGHKTRLVFVYASCAVLYLLVPSALESMYLVNTQFLTALLCALPYCILPCVLYVTGWLLA